MVLYPRAPCSPSSERIRALTFGSFMPEVAMAAGEGQTRTYYIAADEVVWDYAPSGTNLSEARPFNDVERPWMEPGAHFIGRKAKKALYRIHGRHVLHAEATAL